MARGYSDIAKAKCSQAFQPETLYRESPMNQAQQERRRRSKQSDVRATLREMMRLAGVGKGAQQVLNREHFDVSYGLLLTSERCLSDVIVALKHAGVTEPKHKPKPKTKSMPDMPQFSPEAAKWGRQELPPGDRD